MTKGTEAISTLTMLWAFAERAPRATEAIAALPPTAARISFSTLKLVSFGGTVKSTIGVGAIGLERLGDQTIDTVLLGQNLSFVKPEQASAVRLTPAFNMTQRQLSVSSSPPKAPR